MVASGSPMPDSPRSERNASQRPSGDQRGELAVFMFGIEGRGSSLPSERTIQMFDVRGARGSLGSAGSLTTKATCLPSGEIWSSLRSRIERNSSGVMRYVSRPELIGLDVTGFWASPMPDERNVANVIAARAVAIRVGLFKI